MRIKDILKQKEQMANEVNVKSKEVVGKNCKAGNFSFTRVKPSKAKKQTESSDEEN